MSNEKDPLQLDQLEASLALHALRFYKNAKGGEVSSNTESLESKLDEYLCGSTFSVGTVESAASILGTRGGVKGGASTSDAKKAAAAANGAKGGRPRKPNLFIKFTKSVWQEPDPKLLNELYKLAGTNTWLPDEPDIASEGPYVSLYVPEVSNRLESYLKNSLNVWEWDHQALYRYCSEHATELCSELPQAKKGERSCLVCGKPAEWAY